MSATSVTIVQSNKTAQCDLISIHNPVVWIVDVAYIGSAPDNCLVNVYDKGANLLGTFSLIPYSDETNKRTFIFIGSEFLRGFMDSFDDFKGEEKFLEHVPNITKFFQLEFVSDGEYAYTSFYAAHAVQQFGNQPYLKQITENHSTTFYGGANQTIYIYFYNGNPDNEITINDPNLIKWYAADDDDRLFIDDDNYFLYL